MGTTAVGTPVTMAVASAPVMAAAHRRTVQPRNAATAPRTEREEDMEREHSVLRTGKGAIS
ncbi:hypothetical protein GCM10018771_39340 [Streptomyces cellulosae]|nr:hypothetical protein GCM10018771_39340 [Streptomyces cellulosae]